ncbi:MAG: HlyD family secretion protein [Gemmatimonadota bacterium]
MTAVYDQADRPTTVPTTAPPAAAKKRSRIPLMILGAIVIALGIFAWRRLQFGRTHVTTDNAQIDGHITMLSPRVQAFVSEVRVEDNRQVKAGDTLVVLDDRDFKVRLAQAEADLASAQAAVSGRGGTGQASAQRAASVATAAGATATVEAAEATYRKAQADLVRYKSLAAKSIISAQQLDQAQWAVDNAAAALEASRRQAVAAASMSVAADAGVRVAQARFAAAAAAVESARLQLTYTVLTAPISGVVAKRAVEPGVLVQPGQSLMSIVPDEAIWVTANLKETQLEHLKIGDSVEFSVDAYPGVTFRGEVESLSPATGARFSLLPPDNATGNFTKVVQRVPVRIKVDTNRERTHPLRPGMSVELTIKVG